MVALRIEKSYSIVSYTPARTKVSIAGREGPVLQRFSQRSLLQGRGAVLQRFSQRSLLQGRGGRFTEVFTKVSITGMGGPVSRRFPRPARRLKFHDLPGGFHDLPGGFHRRRVCPLFACPGSPPSRLPFVRVSRKPAVAFALCSRVPEARRRVCPLFACPGSPCCACAQHAKHGICLSGVTPLDAVLSGGGRLPGP
jgi:hypothetical protein